MIIKFTFKSGQVKIFKVTSQDFDFREFALSIEDERLAVFSDVAVNMNEVEYFEVVENSSIV